MAKWAKNTSGATKTWEGQEIANNAYYQIQPQEEISWANDSEVLADIGSGDLTIAKDDSGSTDITDTAEAINHLKDDVDPKDTDGVKLSRSKITKSGWHFQSHAVEFTTSKLASVYNKDKSETGYGYTTIKFYDSSDTELVAGTQSELDNNCVKTVITWEPTQDIDVIGGTLYQSSVPTNDTRIWVMAIPDLTVAQGGSVPFATGGCNLKHMGTGAVLDLDGKTAKTLPYDAVYHTNKFQIIVVHDTGDKCPIMMLFKLFRENL